jgi:fluoride ion exporter CrcB/FEX
VGQSPEISCGSEKTIAESKSCIDLTTFSRFRGETVKMLEDGEWLRAGVYVCASVLAGLLLVFVGIHLSNRVSEER